MCVVGDGMELDLGARGDHLIMRSLGERSLGSRSECISLGKLGKAGNVQCPRATVVPARRRQCSPLDDVHVWMYIHYYLPRHGASAQ